MTTTAEELERFLDIAESEYGEDPFAAPPEEAGFVCDTLDKALWVAERLRAASKRIAEAEQVKNDRLTRMAEELESWEQGYTAGARRDVAYFESCLRQYHELQRAQDPKAPKTLKLPGVTATLRRQPDTYQRDEAGLVTWLAEDPLAPAFVEHRPHLLWAELKKHLIVAPTGEVVFDATGEEVPPDLLTVTPGEEKWTVKVEGAQE